MATCLLAIKTSSNTFSWPTVNTNTSFVNPVFTITSYTRSTIFKRLTVLTKAAKRLWTWRVYFTKTCLKTSRTSIRKFMSSILSHQTRTLSYARVRDVKGRSGSKEGQWRNLWSVIPARRSSVVNVCFPFIQGTAICRSWCSSRKISTIGNAKIAKW